MEYSLVSLADCCVIKPPKAEAIAVLKPDDLVSFVPMDSLGINKKVLKLEKTRALADVSGSYTYFAENDVLLAKITPCFENGKLGIATGLTNGIGFGSSEFIVFRPNEHLNSEYLYYFLNQPSFRDAGQAVMTGAVGHKRVPKDFIQATQIPLPPIPEQQRIVAIVDQAFADIEKARANAEKNLKNARELFDSYLNQVFSQRGEGWVENKLGDVCRLINGRAYKKHEMLPEGPYPILRVGNFFTNRSWFYSDLELHEDKYCDYGDLLYAWSASFGPRIWKGDKVIYHYHIWKIGIDATQVDKNYLFYLLEWDTEKIKQTQGTGTTMIHVTKGSMEDRLLPFASLSEQQRIVASLDKLSKEVQQLEKGYQEKLASLEELKKSLLQKAFSGELTKTEGHAA